jgi:hypothetical protein
VRSWRGAELVDRSHWTDATGHASLTLVNRAGLPRSGLPHSGEINRGSACRGPNQGDCGRAELPVFTEVPSVRQGCARSDARAALSKRHDGLRYGDFPPRPQVMPLRVLTDQQRRLKIGKVPEQSYVPMRSALRTRRQITSAFSGARVTKTDRGGLRLLLYRRRSSDRASSNRAGDRHLNRSKGTHLMHFAPRRLTDDQQSSAAR